MTCDRRQQEDVALDFLRRPTIRFGSGTPHQHGSLAGTQAVSLQERLDRLLVIDGTLFIPVKETGPYPHESPHFSRLGDRRDSVRLDRRFNGLCVGADHGIGAERAV
jgi:hypothetical protein